MTWLLDTNAVSELRKVQAGKGDPGVAAWQAGVPRVELYLSAVTVMELEMGVLQMERKDTDQGAFGPGRVIMKRSACGVCRPLPHSPAPPPPWRWMWRGPLLEQLKGQTDPKLLALLRTPLSAILVGIDDKDRYKAGLALEALAFKIMRLLNMTYVATRLRANQTGGAEVDFVFESARLVFSRWQVQCKNTARVSLDDVAKEVGLTHFLKSNVVVMVTTGEIGGEARRYANKIMADSNRAIVMLDGGDLSAISESPATIVRSFEREARHAMNLKKLEL